MTESSYYQTTAYNSRQQYIDEREPDQWLPYSAHGTTRPHITESCLFLLACNWNSHKTILSEENEQISTKEIPKSSLHKKANYNGRNSGVRFITHDHWEMQSTKAMAYLFLLSVGFALLFGLFSPIAMILLALSESDFSVIYDPTILFITIFFWSYYFAGNHLLKTGKIPNHSEATLFRSTGMVHYFPGKNKDPIIKPYREYDCSISQTSGVKGGAYLSLWMSNRYDKKIKFGLPNQPGSIFSARVTAEMIECFMDISRPLPDVPELELYRPYDPVTAAWDKKYERPPRLFRDMSKETWDKLKDATWRYAETYPWGKDRKTAIAMGWQPPPKQWWKMADDPS